LSLDKWIKDEKEEEKKDKTKKKKKDLKKKPQSESSSQKIETPTTHDKQLTKLTKYVLICPKKSCGYQKILRKKQLIDRDKICPRCKGNMKVKK
jgi:hypothetical protein